MTPDNVITLLIGIGTIAGSVLGARWMFIYQMKRAQSQNQLDDASAGVKAFELANMSLERQADMQTKIDELEGQVSVFKAFTKRQRYRATLEFEDGPALANVDPVLMIARLERIKETELAAK